MSDGFLSQWASGLNAQKKRLQATITENGDRYEFPALFDLSGKLVPAKLLQTRYGQAWAIFESHDSLNADGEILAWVNAFPMRESTMRNKGYAEGIVTAPARADMRGENNVYVTAIRTSYYLADTEVVSINSHTI